MQLSLCFYFSSLLYVVQVWLLFPFLFIYLYFFSGKECNVRDNCQGYNCNKGKCHVTSRNQPSCRCPHGYSGKHCEMRKLKNWLIEIKKYDFGLSLITQLNCKKNFRRQKLPSKEAYRELHSFRKQQKEMQVNFKFF